MNRILITLFLIGSLTACSTERIKENRKRRDDVFQKVGLFCEFVRLDSAVELDVDVNLKMSDSCDPQRPFSLTSLQDAEERKGVLYCCSLSPEAARLRISTRSNPTVASPIPDPALRTPHPVPYIDPKDLPKDSKDTKDIKAPPPAPALPKK